MSDKRKAIPLPPPYGQEALIVDMATNQTQARLKKTVFEIQVYRPNENRISLDSESALTDYLHSEFASLYGYEPCLTIISTRRARFAKDRC